MKVKLIHPNAKPPRKPKDGDAGHDLFCCEQVFIPAKTRACVSTGVCLEIPNGVVGLIWPRSGYAVEFGLDTLAGVVDSSYRGEVKVLLYNTGDKDILLEAGAKIAQMLFQNYLTYNFDIVECLDETERGANGFGSSGQ